MKVCIVGSSGHGANAVKAAKCLSDIQYTGYCPSYAEEDLAKLEAEFAANGLSPKKHRDYKQMIEQEKPDILVVDTIFSEHFRTARYALEHNIHVYCDKPLALHPDELDTIAKLTGADGAPVLWAMQTPGTTPGCIPPKSCWNRTSWERSA
jgi:predicted dehydrogenase